MANERWVTVQEAAMLSAVSKGTIYNWIKAGRMRAIASPTGRIRVLVTDAVTAWKELPNNKESE